MFGSDGNWSTVDGEYPVVRAINQTEQLDER